MPLATTSFRSQITGWAAGRRENCENSSTSRFTEAVSSRIVSAHSRTTLSDCRRRHALLPVQLPQNTLRRKRDRRQRILDFVRHAPRHFAPRGDLLRAQQIARVLDDDDEARHPAAAPSMAETVIARCSVLRGVFTSSCCVAWPGAPRAVHQIADLGRILAREQIVEARGCARIRSPGKISASALFTS